MAAVERRRRVMQNLMAETVHVWWQVWSFQQLKDDLSVVREDVEQALSQSDRIISQRLVDPIRFIEYRKQLFYVLRRLDGLALQLDQAENRLVELLNLKSGTTLELRDGEELMADAITYGVPDVEVRHWQQAALMNRPEIRMAAYEGRAAISEAKRRLWGVFPRIGFRAGHNYSSNSFLENNTWAEGGVNISVDLLRLTSIPSLRRNKSLVEQLVEAKQKAIGGAVLSQVAIADKAYRQNLRSWCMSDQLLSLDGQRAQLLEAKSSAAALDRLSLVQARTDHLLLRFEVAMAFADLQRDRMRLMLSAGLISDPPQTEQGIDSEAFPEWLYKGLYQNAGVEVASAAEALGEPVVLPERAVRSELCK
jgi:outer membrane protein TolC